MKNGAGAAIEVEVWALSESAFGRFVAAVPPPLSIGTLELDGGRAVKGFLVEAEAVADARDISSFGGWRAFMAQEKAHGLTAKPHPLPQFQDLVERFDRHTIF